MKILVMGGTEFVSRNIAKYFIENNYVVDILTRGYREINYHGFNKHIICDRNDDNSLSKILCNNVYDYVIDVSAYNEEHIEKLLNIPVIKNIKKYIFISSAAVYSKNNQLTKEDCHTGLNKHWGDYGKNKNKAEAVIINSDINYTILRPPYIYGEDNNLYREGYIIDSYDEGFVTIPKSNSKIQFLHVKDLSMIIESCLDNNKANNEIYNVAYPKEYKFIDWSLALNKCLNKDIEIIEFEKQDYLQVCNRLREWFPFRDINLSLDISKLKEHNIYLPKLDFTQEIYNIYKIYKKNNRSSVFKTDKEKMFNVIKEIKKCK